MTAPGVLLIGAGGLGSGAALALGAAGLSRLGVVDDDVVDESNLHRQVLHEEAWVGKPKVDSFRAALERRFPAMAVRVYPTRLEPQNAVALLDEYDVVVDGSDNLGTKFLANDAAVLTGRPLVHGAAVGTFGQLLTVPAGGRPCYRCLFEELPPADADAPSCAEAGVLGPVPGVIGALQGVEAMRLVRGEAPAFVGRLIRYDSPALSLRTVSFGANLRCRVCGSAPSITRLRPELYRQEAC